MRTKLDSQKELEDPGGRSAARPILADGTEPDAEEAEAFLAEALKDFQETETDPAIGTRQRVREISGEEDLISRSLAGDQLAFEALVRRHSPRVFNIAGSFFRRRDLIEDIAQEVFTKAYFSLGSFTVGRSFEAWLARITVNACYDYFRAQRRRMQLQMPLAAGQREDEWLEIQMFEAAVDRHSSEERQREAADLAERLMSKLDPDDRVVLVLMDKEGFSAKDVSEMTGWGVSKVKVRAFRARRALRAAMNRLMAGAGRRQRSSK